MSATQTVEFHCSCGRTFAHEISLKRHCWVTGHTAEAIAEVAPVVEEVVTVAAPLTTVEMTLAAVDVVDEAVRILRAKQQAQMAFESRQARERQVRVALDCASSAVSQGMQIAAQTSRQGAEVVRHSVMMAMRMLLMILVCGGLLLAGMGVGRLLAAPADAAPSPAGQRQLVGFQAQQ